jgi:hypothetical protein
MAWTYRTPSSGKEASNSTSHTITMPATVVAGDLLIAIFFTDGSETITWDNSTLGAWTQMNWSPQIGGSASTTMAGYYKTAAGTEGGATITVTTGTTEAATWVVFAIAGWHGTTAPEGTATASGGVTGPDPASHAASWGAEANLWIALSGSDSVDRIDNTGGLGWPSGYSNTGETDNAVAGATNLAWATKEATSPENPAAFTWNGTNQKIALTMAIRPAAVGGGTTRGTPFGNRSTAFNGGRVFHGPIN